MTVVLLSQPDLAFKVRFALQEALYQSIAIRYQLPPFDLEETAGTIRRDPRVAGFAGGLFSDNFISGVYDGTKGVARRINNLYRRALLLAASEGEQILDESDLKRGILGLEGPNS